MNTAKAGRPQGASPSSVSSASSTRWGRGRELRRRTRWRLPVVPLAIAMVSLAGAGLLLYPAAAAWVSAVEQSRAIDSLTQGITDLGAETLRERVAEAYEYNQNLSGGGAAVAANERYRSPTTRVAQTTASTARCCAVTPRA